MTDPIQAMMAAGDFDGAAAAVERQLAGGFDPGVAIQLFGIHIFRGDPAAAQAVLRDVMSRTPEIQPHDLLANTSAARDFLGRRGDPELAANRKLVLSGGGAPDPWLAELIKASYEHAGGNHQAAAAAVASARSLTPAIAGTLIHPDGEQVRFERVTDSDDLTGPTLPCFAGPDLIDIPLTGVAGLELAERRASWDWMWMPASIALRDGRRLDVRIPASYPGTAGHPEPSVRLNRQTLWDHDHGYAVAVGMVDYWFDRRMVGIESVAAIRFD